MNRPTRQDALDALALVKNDKIEVTRAINAALGNGAGAPLIVSRVGRFDHAWTIPDAERFSNTWGEHWVREYWLRTLSLFANRDVLAYLKLHPHCAYATDGDGVIELTDDDDKVHFLLSMPGVKS